MTYTLLRLGRRRFKSQCLVSRTTAYTGTQYIPVPGESLRWQWSRRFTYKRVVFSDTRRQRRERDIVQDRLSYRRKIYIIIGFRFSQFMSYFTFHTFFFKQFITDVLWSADILYDSTINHRPALTSSITRFITDTIAANMWLYYNLKKCYDHLYSTVIFEPKTEERFFFLIHTFFCHRR